MTLPSSFTNFYNLHYYQGVLLAEVFLTLFLYTLLKIIHYIKWGHDEEAATAEKG
jgi:nicotinamide riboside transporter PnuC